MPTKLRNIRVDDAIWEAAKAKAERTNTTVSAVIVNFLSGYAAVAKNPARYVDGYVDGNGNPLKASVTVTSQHLPLARTQVTPIPKQKK